MDVKEKGMKKLIRLAGVMAAVVAIVSASVFTSAVFADGYDVEYGEWADIARASQWETEGGYAGAHYYENEAAYSKSSSSKSSSKSSVSTPDDYYGDCWWSGSTAHWDSEREKGEKYQVQLRKGGTEVAVIKTSSTSYNFSSYIKSDGNYKFRVRLVNGSKHGGWGDYSDTKYFEGRSSSSSSSSSSRSSSSSSSGVVAGSTGGPGASSSQAGWQRDNKGWWYRRANGSYPANCWEFINGKWYFFGSTGYMVTGWIQWNGLWYFCGADGAMYTNTYTPDGYYVDANGVMRQ